MDVGDIAKLRQVIERVRPLIREFDGSLEELEGEADDLNADIDRHFVSDISDPEALLVAALVRRLEGRLAIIEERMVKGTDPGYPVRPLVTWKKKGGACPT